MKFLSKNNCIHFNEYLPSTKRLRIEDRPRLHEWGTDRGYMNGGQTAVTFQLHEFTISNS